MFQATSKQPTESESPRDAYHNSARSGCPFRPQACIKPEGSPVCKTNTSEFQTSSTLVPQLLYVLSSGFTPAWQWQARQLHITKCCWRLLTKPIHDWFNFQIPSYPGTMTYKYYVDFTISHATSSHSLLSSMSICCIDTSSIRSSQWSARSMSPALAPEK